jgi:hypothetical protein
VQDGTRDGYEQERCEDADGTTFSELARRWHPPMILLVVTLNWLEDLNKRMSAK